MTVKDLFKNIQNGELVIFREEGKTLAITRISHAEESDIPKSIEDKSVKNDEWWNISITTAHGDEVYVPCHCIDL